MRAARRLTPDERVRALEEGQRMINIRASVKPKPVDEGAIIERVVGRVRQDGSRETIAAKAVVGASVALASTGAALATGVPIVFAALAGLAVPPLDYVATPRLAALFRKLRARRRST